MEEIVKVPMWKRILGLIIDLLIVSLLSALVMFVMPHNEKYNETLSSSSSIKELLSKETYDRKEYMKVSNELTYDSYKYGVLENSITIVIVLSYFSLFTFFNHGKTIGKMLVKTRVTNLEGNDPNLLSSLGRSFLITRSFGDIVTLILVLSMKKTTFVNVYYYVDLVLTLIWISCPIVAIWRQDGRGVHDLIFKTKVIDLKKESVIEEEKRKRPQDEEVKEAVIEEKKEKKTTKKKNNKKNNK